MHKTALAAKVVAVNNAHAYAKKLYPVLAEFFKPYIGQRIEKADGTLFKKIADVMPPFPDTGLNEFRLHVYRHTSDYSLAWTVKACESSPSRHSDCQIANYYETTVYIGDMRDGVLTKISDPPTYLRIDYSSEDVEAARVKYAEAKKAADDARSALWPFGE